MAAATMYVTVAGAGDKDGRDWANAMDYAAWESDAESSVEAGDIYYVAGGTYTLTSDFNVANDGTQAAPITIIGVNSGTTNEPPVYSDWAAGDNRPLITDGASAYTFAWDNYTILRNLRVESGDTESLRADMGASIENCKATNDSGTADRAAISVQAGGGLASSIINNEAICTNGYAINAIGSGGILFNYAHDSKTGIYLGSDYAVVSNNVIDTVTLGIVVGNTNPGIKILFNTIYAGGGKAEGSVGISVGTACDSFIITHNIITDFETGVSFGDTTSNIGYYDYNNYYDNTTDRTNVPVGNNDMDVDPKFDTPGSDFSLQSDSGCINTGITLLGT